MVEIDALKVCPKHMPKETMLIIQVHALVNLPNRHVSFIDSISPNQIGMSARPTTRFGSSNIGRIFSVSLFAFRTNFEKPRPTGQTCRWGKVSLPTISLVAKHLR